MQKKLGILVLGANGMLGSALLKAFSTINQFSTFGTVRDSRTKLQIHANLRDQVIEGIQPDNLDTLLTLLCKLRPDYVINCIGLVKQDKQSNDILKALPINALFPHRLSALCKLAKSRLVHISTDCVFQGDKSFYTEESIADAQDLYGRSKYLGEVHDDHTVTIRTSLIGHQLDISGTSLIDWFLSKNGEIEGYKNAIFSGLPTNELANILINYIFTNKHLSGLYHVSSNPISKYDLLTVVSRVYKKNILIKENFDFKIDRSLNSKKFQNATGYIIKPWDTLIKDMHEFNLVK